MIFEIDNKWIFVVLAIIIYIGAMLYNVKCLEDKKQGTQDNKQSTQDKKQGTQSTQDKKDDIKQDNKQDIKFL